MSVPQSPVPSQEAHVDAAPAESSSLQSLSRRRTLLAGIGRAGALAGAAVPLSSLATGSKPGMRLNKTGKYYVCSVSGQNSVVHSAQAVGTPDCSGKNVAYYCQKSTAGVYVNWPMSGTTPVCPLNGTNYTSAALFWVVFGCNLSSKSLNTLGVILDSYPTSDEAHWIAALLNATKMGSSFPFTPGEVKSMCMDTAQRGAAFSFFTSFLEQSI